MVINITAPAISIVAANNSRCAITCLRCLCSKLPGVPCTRCCVQLNIVRSFMLAYVCAHLAHSVQGEVIAAGGAGG